ncbi:MAG: hypothetical protein Q7T04_01595, partial [Dehalococcoidia bacterium]|nr:hypothetical protein [Dehalococcoidia bacterium]
MRNLKYLGLFIALFLAVVLPVSAVSADSGAQVRIMPRTVIERGDGVAKWQGSVKPQQFTPLTGKLRSPEDGAKRYAIIIGSNYESLPEDASIPPFVPSFATRLNWAVND